MEHHQGFLQHGGHQPVWFHQNHVGLSPISPSQQRSVQIPAASSCFFSVFSTGFVLLCRSDGLHLQHLLLLHLPEHGCLQCVQERPGGFCRLSEGGDGEFWRKGIRAPCPPLSWTFSFSWVWQWGQIGPSVVMFASFLSGQHHPARKLRPSHKHPEDNDLL